MRESRPSFVSGPLTGPTARTGTRSASGLPASAGLGASPGHDLAAAVIVRPHVQPTGPRPGGARGNRHRQADQRRRGDAQLLPRLCDERHHLARPAGRARRSEAVAAPHPGGDARPQPGTRAAVPEVRQDRRRHLGELPPARRVGDLPDPGPVGPDLQHALPAGGRPGQLRLGGRRPAGRDAVHRVADDPSRRRDAGRHRQGHRRLEQQLRRHAQRAVGAAWPLPEPDLQRLGRHRGRHGDEHPAAQPERGRGRAAGLDRQPRGDRRRPAASTSPARTSRPAAS